MNDITRPRSHSQPGPPLFLGDTDDPKGSINCVLLRPSLEPRGKYIQDLPSTQWSTCV